MDNYRQLLEQRIQINQRAETDLIFRKEVLDECFEDSVYWCNNFAFTFDPRQEFYKLRKIPYILWPKQIELVRWIEGLLDNREDGVVEKSRDLGVSYTVLTPVILYRWLFHEFNAKIGSRKEELVDRSDDPDSLFWKLDYTLRNLPEWMLPEGFDWKQHRTYMRLSRPDNDNVITGESANENFARAGRNNLTLLDEHGFWNWAKSSWESCGESTTTRLSVSTPPKSGKLSFFYKLVKSGKAKKFTFHVSDDPRKGKEWYTHQKTKKSDEEYAREIDISYSGSLEGTVYAAQLALCRQEPIAYDANLPLFVAWDFGRDSTAMQWYQWNKKLAKWYLIDSYENSNIDIGFYIPFVTGVVVSEPSYNYTLDDLKVINRHKDWRQDITHFGDPDVKKTAYQVPGDLSTFDVLKKSGIIVQSKSWAGRSHYDLRQPTLLFLKKLIVDSKYNEHFIDCITSAKYPERSETSQSTSDPIKPIHDWTSHHRTALEYMADNVATFDKTSTSTTINQKPMYTLGHVLTTDRPTKKVQIKGGIYG